MLKKSKNFQALHSFLIFAGFIVGAARISAADQWRPDSMAESDSLPAARLVGPSLLETIRREDDNVNNLRRNRGRDIMSLWALTYDQRATHHDYSNLYQLLNTWSAAHL
jgi:hypothetical protein